MKQVVLFVLASFIVAGALAQPLVKYVTQNGAGLRNGSSWANAWNDSIFAANLHLQPAGTEVWVAKGTYRPNYGQASFPNPPSPSIYYSFSVPNGVKLYGGFAGIEASIGDRTAALIHTANKTMLTGNVGPAGIKAQFVVEMRNCSQGEKLDGLTISDADKTGLRLTIPSNPTTTPVINNCIIKGNGQANADTAGGIAIHAVGNSNITISNCFIMGNTGGIAGAIYCGNAKANMVNCVFGGNNAFYIVPNYNCSGVYFRNGGGNITNCTFVGNRTETNTSVLSSETVTDSIYITNSIFWANYFYNAAHVVNNLQVAFAGSNKFSVKNCLFQQPTHGNSPATFVNSFSASPFFENIDNSLGTDGQWGTGDDGLRLTPCSPALNVGNAAFVTGITDDILGNGRSFSSGIDLGAYELQQPAATVIVVQQQPVSVVAATTDTARFSVAATGGNIGYQWQVYSSSNGWVNLANDLMYNGVTTPQLKVANLSSIYQYGNIPFRCLINNQFCTGLASNMAKLFVRQPDSASICQSGGLYLYVNDGNLHSPANYRWQVDMGNGYQNVNNGPNYSGATTGTLQLINIPSAWYGYKYRCYDAIADNYGAVYILKITNTWRGTVNNSWQNPANWSCGQVPDAYTDVTIGTTTVAGSIYPSNVTVGANSICRSLTVLPGGNTVTVLPGFTLTVVH